MLERLGRFTVRRRRAVLAVTALALVVAAAVGGGVASRLSSGGFTDPGSQSSRAERALRTVFHTGEPNVVLLVTARHGTVDTPVVAAAGQELTTDLARRPGVESVFSYWSLGRVPPLRSVDAQQGLVLARISGSDDQVRTRIKVLSPQFARTTPDVTVRVGGQAEVYRQVGTQTELDLRRAEAITFPLVLVLLVLVFGSVVAAGLPLAVAGLAIVGAFVVLRVLVGVTDVSIFALNLTTAMGIGLGVDYSLFIVSRYREELRAGVSPDVAVVRSIQTAGHTVLFSALTVAASLAALLVFPLFFLRSFAYAGIAVVALAAAAALIPLPAVLAVLGRKVDSWSPIHHKVVPVGEGFWHRLAVTVMRRPVRSAGAVVALLLVLGVPFLGIRFGLPDDRVLPRSASSRQVQNQLRHNFASRESSALSVVLPRLDAARPARDARINGYAAALSNLAGVARVDAVTGSYVNGRLLAGPGPASARFVAPRATWLSVVPSIEPQSPAGERLVKQVRATGAPFGAIVGGRSAELVDAKHGIFTRVPLAAAIIALVTFLLLFSMTGSVLVPVKALVLNLLSLSATFGAMVWIFQEGHLSGVLGFTSTGTLDTSMPILMFCIAFGLSMDYEVFLLSRIKEEHDRGADNTTAVAVGLERTGRIVTAAAALLAVVFIAFATSRVTFLKLLGVGMALAVLMDATLVRGVLVPAFMRLAGQANWWAPAPLRRVYERFGIHETALAVDGASGTFAEPPPLEPAGSRRDS